MSVDKTPSSRISGMFGGPALKPGTTARKVEAPEISGEQLRETLEQQQHRERNNTRRENLAEDHGFVSRQASPIPARRRRVKSDEAQQSVSFRLPLSVHRRFVNFTNNSGAQSYWDAIERLMDMSGIGPNGEEPEN